MNVKGMILALFLSHLIFPFPMTKLFQEAPPEMKIHFIDVGQGDSILLQTPSGKNILIDGGPPSAGRKVVAYLRELKIKHLDLMIATHPDKDHIGGLSHVMKSVHVKQIIDSGKLHTTKTYKKYIDQIQKQNIPVRIAEKNDYIFIDPKLTIQVLNSFDKMKNNNQSSIVLKINFEDMDILLMGDVEHEQEQELLRTKNMDADIVKVAHHGSRTSTSLAFLQEVNPKVALLTYSKRNDYGHPVNRVIENLNKVKALIYSTAVFGNIEIRTDGKEIFIFPEKSPADGLLESAG